MCSGWARECLCEGVCVCSVPRRSARGDTAGAAALRTQQAEAGLGPQLSPPLLHVRQEPPRCCGESGRAGERGGGCGQSGWAGGWRGEKREEGWTRWEGRGGGGKSGGSRRRRSPLPSAVAVGSPAYVLGSGFWGWGMVKGLPLITY